MKIIEWITSPFSDRIGLAIIAVEPDEVADIEKMLVLIDGDSVGHYGLSAKLVGTENGVFDIHKYAKLRKANKFAMGQFGYDRYSSQIKQCRYYEVHVSRD